MKKVILSSSLAVLALATTSFAAQLDWAPLAPSPAYGGTGTWESGVGTTWKNGGGTSVLWNNANLDIAKFEFGPGTVTVAPAGVTASQLIFGSNPGAGYNLTGGLITLTGNGQNLIEGQNYSGTNTITSNITTAIGTGRMKIYGGTAAILNLNGGIDITGGGAKVLHFDNETVGNTLNVNSTITAPAATLSVLVGNENGASDAVYNFTGTSTGLDSTADIFRADRGTIQIGNAAALGSASVQVGQNLLNAAQKASLKTTAPMTISNPIQVTGPTSSATYVLGSTVAGTTTFSGAVALDRNTTLETVAGTSLVFSGVVSGNGGIIKNGPGTATLTSATGNTLTGASTVNAGKLLLTTASNVDYALRGSVNVKNGATFGGTGHLNDYASDSVIESGGILQVGNLTDTLGALRIDGGLILNSGAHIALSLGAGLDSSVLEKSDGGEVDWILSNTITFDLTMLPGATTGTYAGIIVLNGYGSVPSITNWTISNPDVTGTFAVVGDNINLTLTAVPEPGTTMLIGLGLASLLFFRRRSTINA